VNLLASAIPTGRNETEPLLFMKASACPLAWLLAVTQRPFGQHKGYDKRRQRRTGKREKPLPKGFNRNLLSLSLQALAFNSHSKQTLQLRHSMERRRKHMETETKAMLRLLPSKSTRNTTANPLRCFSYFTYHTFCSLSLSRGNLEERKNQQSRRTKTQQRSQRNGKEKEKSF
jgi:hypothetical protein